VAITIPADLLSQKNTLVATGDGSWQWLLKLDRDGTNYLYYCAPSHENITFDSQVYTATTMEIRPPQTDMGGGAKNFHISVQNVDQTMVTDLEAGEFLDRPVELFVVHTDHLSTTSNFIPKIRGLIIEASVREDWCTFTCGTYDLRGVTVPRQTYSRERCRWVFKSDECGYAGGETSCDKRLTTCDSTMSNKSRFGGFPGMPMQRP
jgi:hypothetical protein